MLQIQHNKIYINLSNEDKLLIYSIDDLTDCSINEDIYDNHITDSQMMFRSVLARVIRDVSSTSKKPEKIIWKKQAIYYILNYTPDFVLVCELAGYENPISIFEELNKYLENYENKY